ncbi:MAG: tandem-95 repeat protein [Planctomycetota bacterium]
MGSPLLSLSPIPGSHTTVISPAPEDVLGLVFAATNNGNPSGAYQTNQIELFGNVGDQYQPDGSTTGTLENLPGLTAGNQIHAFHYLQSDLITLGTGDNQMSLRSGDILLVVSDGSGNNVSLNNGRGGTLNAGEADLLVYRPNNPQDYSTGQYSMLLNDVFQLGASNTLQSINGLTLVEKSTSIGGTNIAQGELLVSISAPSDGVSSRAHVYRASLESLGAGDTGSIGSLNLLLDLEDIGLDTGEIRGLELLQESTVFGGTTLNAGTLLFTANVSTTATISGVAGFDRGDVFATTFSGNETNTGTATSSVIELLDHSTINPNGHTINGLSIVPESLPTTAEVNGFNTIPVAVAAAPVSINAGDDLVLDASASFDFETSNTGLTFSWETLGGTQIAAGTNPTVAWATLVSNNLITANTTQELRLRVTDGGGAVGTTLQSFSVNGAQPSIAVTANSFAVHQSGTIDVAIDQLGGLAITALSVNWGDGNTTTENPSATTFDHTYSSSGTFNAIVSITVDGTVHTQSANVLVTNSPPTISSLGDLVVNENSSGHLVNFVIGDNETPTSNLTVSVSSSDNTLFPASGMVLGGSNANRTLTLKPATHQFGTANIFVTVSDGEVQSQEFFQVTVNEGNDAPTISGVANQSVMENSGSTSVNFTIDDEQSAANLLTVSATSNNASLIAPSSLVFSGTGANRTLSFTPTTNTFGTAIVSVSVSDGARTTETSFQVTVNELNDAPTVSNVADQTVQENSASTNVSFTIADEQTAAASLTVNATSDNTALISNASLVVSGTAGNRTVSFTPTANSFGTANITITVSDGVLQVQETFQVTVEELNDAPTISNVADQTVQENSASTSVNFTIADEQTAAGSLTVHATSDNTALISNAALVVSGTGGNRSISFTPTANSFGVANITITVSDGIIPVQETFRVTVEELNDSPTISSIGNQSVIENSGASSVNFTIADEQTAAAALTVSAVSDNTALIANPNLAISGTGANRTLTFTPIADQFGIANITVHVSDGVLSSSTTFRVSVAEQNDPPTITPIADSTIDVSSTGNSVTFQIGDNQSAPSGLVVAAISDNSFVIPTSTLSLTGTGTNRTLAFDPIPGRVGTANIIVFVSDGALLTTETFRVDVTQMNRAPVLAIGTEFTIDNDQILVQAATYFDALASDADNDTLSAVVVLDTANGTLAVNSDGSFTYQPDVGFYGQDDFQWQASDGVLYSTTRTVIINVERSLADIVQSGPGGGASGGDEGAANNDTGDGNTLDSTLQNYQTQPNPGSSGGNNAVTDTDLTEIVILATVETGFSDASDGSVLIASTGRANLSDIFLGGDASNLKRLFDADDFQTIDGLGVATLTTVPLQQFHESLLTQMSAADESAALAAQEIASELQKNQFMIGVAAIGTGGATIGSFVLFAMRASWGLAAGTLLTQVPALRFLDPMTMMAGNDEKAKSLEEIMEEEAAELQKRKNDPEFDAART